MPAVPARWRLAVLLLAAPVVAGAVMSLLEPTRYRAEATVVVGESPRSPSRAEADSLATLRELVRSDIVARAALRDLGLEDLSASELIDRVGVRVPPGTSLLVISADAGSRQEAERLAQQVGLVFTQLALERFPQLHASLFGSAHALEGRVSPHWWRNLGGGALVGAVLAALAVALSGRRALPGPELARAEAAPQPAPEPAPEPEPKPEPEPVPEPEPEPVPEPELEPEPEPEPEPEAEPEPEPSPGEWSVAGLERLVEARAGAFPERAEEWRAYLEALATQADSRGILPTRLDPLVRDVFAELIEE
jgi:capsular polysaccharide biosynthesis protein